jgi:hypothetical protein
MATEFKRGDHVEWNSEAGRVRGTIRRKVTREIVFKGYRRHASKEEPQYVIQSDKTDHLAIHKGSAPHLQPVEPALPLLHLRVRAEAMLKEQELAARLEHAVHFPQRLVHLLDAAQRKGADDAIEGAVLEGEPFAAEQPPVNLDPCLLDPPSCPAVHPAVRIDGRDLADVGG